MPKRRPRKRTASQDPTPPGPRPTTTDIDAPPGWVAKRYHTVEAGPDYTCPRCHRVVQRRTEHIVAWTLETQTERRHWHSACWRSAVKEGVDRYRFG